MMIRFPLFFAAFLQGVAAFAQRPAIQIEQTQYQVPVLSHKAYNAVLRLKMTVPPGGDTTLDGLTIDLTGTTDPTAIRSVDVLYTGADSVWKGGLDNPQAVFGSSGKVRAQVSIAGRRPLQEGTHFFWVSYALADRADAGAYVGSACTKATFGTDEVVPARHNGPIRQRTGVALRQHMQDGVHTSRIPGLATTNKGTLLAIFDARYESARDLQGHMDIGLHRSTDGGQTWEPLQIAMDMGEWGGLPQRFNGVSDACILVDKKSDAIYIAGLWMYGVIGDDGNWVEGLTDTSTVWNHQWRTKGSQPGFGVKQTSQFLVVKSTDDGKTWGEPMNLTEHCKRAEWWLWAPAPGAGITMRDGTLVFPTQGRDAVGKSFSNITYSKDGGKTWQTSNPALDVPAGTTECAVVERTDGSLMLNMRANSNRGNEGPDNGRAIAVTHDLGNTWHEHPTSFRALPEPTCMASLYTHEYTTNGETKRVLIFLNPHSKTAREDMTLKVSFDDGLTWPEANWVLLDEGRSRGYSCITSVDDGHIGVLYESSQADLVFQRIPLGELTDPGR